jgi:hypothetical protein
VNSSVPHGVLCGGPSATIRNAEVDGSANLAIAGVFRQKQGLPGARDPEEPWEAGFELVLPVDRKAQAIDVVGQAALRAGDAQLGNDGLSHAGAAGPSPQAQSAAVPLPNGSCDHAPICRSQEE